MNMAKSMHVIIKWYTFSNRFKQLRRDILLTIDLNNFDTIYFR